MTKYLALSLLVLICHAAHPSFGIKIPLIYESCHNQESLCFGFPENCVTNSNCQIVFRSQFEPTSSQFQLELTALTIVQNKYVAVGFANSSGMSGLVVYCTQSSNKNQSAIQYAFNKYNEYSNSQITNRNDVTGFTNLESSYQDGQLQCRWQIEQPAQVHYNGSVFDFDGDKFYIQLATGPFDQIRNNIQYHESNKVSSKSSVSLKRFPIQKSHERLAAEALEKRAVELVEVHKKSLKQLQNDSSLQGALVSAIESELILVEALITELRTQITDTSKPLNHHNLLLLEEQLIRHELKLTEQLTAAQLAVIDQKKNEEAKKPVDPAKLVEKANELIKKGTDALVSASSTEFSSIQLEIHEIETMVRAIQAKPSASEFREDKLLLEQHERALQILIDRINGKKN